MNSDKKKIYIFFLIYFTIHIIFINNYPINFEFTFSNFSKFFENYDKKIIDQYFLSQANTIVFPFVADVVVVELVVLLSSVVNDFILSKSLNTHSYRSISVSLSPPFSVMKPNL